MKRIFGSIRRATLFSVVGLVTVAPGEFNYSYLLRKDLPNFIGACFFNFLYLLAAYAVIDLLRRFIASPRGLFATITILAGIAGLGVEWFVIGNSPWGNPAALQSAMFAYWAAMVATPFVLLAPEANPSTLKRKIFEFWAVWSFASLALTWWGMGRDDRLGFAIGIWSVAAEYVAFAYFFYLYFRYSLKKKDA